PLRDKRVHAVPHAVVELEEVAARFGAELPLAAPEERRPRGLVEAVAAGERDVDAETAARADLGEDLREELALPLPEVRRAGERPVAEVDRALVVRRARAEELL